MNRDSEIRDQDLSLPLDIDTERWARLSRGIIRLACTVFGLLLLIAATAPVREITIANGQLTTPNPPLMVEHFDGGIVHEIVARQGQVVRAGAPVVLLSSAQVESELAQIRSRHAHQSLQRERLFAMVESRSPDFHDYRDEFASLVKEQSALFVAEKAAILSEEQATQAEMSELGLEQQAADRETDSLLAQFNNAQAEVELQQGLLNKGLSTRSRMLVVQREMERLRGDMAAAQRSSLAALRAISEARRRLSSRSSERLQIWSEQITELSASIAELEETERQHLARLDRLEVRSPVAGVVHELSVLGIGDVVGPGDHVATIVPNSAELIAEVRLAPADIGFVEVGSPAEVTVTTFDREVFGTLPAQTLSISPTTFQTQDEEAHYLVQLAIGSLTRDAGDGSGDLLPGMVVHAEFRTGEKSVLRYMLKPIFRAMDSAFTER